MSCKIREKPATSILYYGERKFIFFYFLIFFKINVVGGIENSAGRGFALFVSIYQHFISACERELCQLYSPVLAISLKRTPYSF